MKLAKLLFLTLIIAKLAIATPLLPLKCQTPHGEKVFTIWPKQIVFRMKNQLHFDQSRTISSVSKMRTIPNVQGGFDKYLKHGGHNYRIHINNPAQLDPVHDYISIEIPNGHRISYPLTCRSGE